MWSHEFNNNGNNTHEDYKYYYKNADHPKHIDFTIDEVVMMSHDAGTAGTHWAISIEKDVGNGRTRRYYGIGIHVRDWLRLFHRELTRVQSGQPLTRYTAVRAREHYWVEPDMCLPAIDSSDYQATTSANKKRMVA